MARVSAFGRVHRYTSDHVDPTLLDTGLLEVRIIHNGPEATRDAQPGRVRQRLARGGREQARIVLLENVYIDNVSGAPLGSWEENAHREPGSLSGRGSLAAVGRPRWQATQLAGC